MKVKIKPIRITLAENLSSVADRKKPFKTQVGDKIFVFVVAKSSVVDSDRSLVPF
jgi:hypothetical protein